MIVRFALVQSVPGISTDQQKVDTGANYPGCSPATPGACNPIQFGTLRDAQYYASVHGENLYVVQSEAEAWQLVAHPENLPPMPAPGGGIPSFLSSTSPLLLFGAVGLGLYLFTRRRSA